MEKEKILYDKVNHRAHSLNESAALVWQNADGNKSVGELSELLNRELGIPADEKVVVLAVKQLGEAGLLEEFSPAEVNPELVSRRQLARNFGLAGASAGLLPFVVSVLAPTPAMAGSAVSKITPGKALHDLTTVTVEADLDPAFYHSRTAQVDLGQATQAFAKGQYPTEETDLNGVINALGLPPL
ncbi:MAG TPA: PqqD family protein [Bryobacteraceae bacterium]|nr:PqqD family protein [Bryobacteraceae bacterium]